MTSERPYLSVGEVLELLRGEFADLSIARVREFEAAGLLRPERTPSGYRKFYEDDIARLRSLLGGTTGPHRPTEENPPVEPPVTPEHEHAVTAAEARHPAAAHRVQPRSRIGGREASTDRPGGAASTIRTEGEVPAPVTRRERPSPARLVVVRDGREPPAASGRRRANPAPAGEALPGTSVDPGTAGPGAVVASQQDPPAHASTGDGGRGVPTGADPAGIAGHGEHPAHAARAEPAGATAGVTLSLAELATAAGADAALVHELESYGLVRGRAVFGSTVYDEDALLVTRAAAALAERGIEPRHLRLYRSLAERELALYEQLLAPRLRARSGEERQRAGAALAELVRLGEQLRTATVRVAARASMDALGTTTER